MRHVLMMWFTTRYASASVLLVASSSAMRSARVGERVPPLRTALTDVSGRQQTAIAVTKTMNHTWIGFARRLDLISTGTQHLRD